MDHGKFFPHERSTYRLTQPTPTSYRDAFPCRPGNAARPLALLLLEVRDFDAVATSVDAPGRG